jgi:hypothetical protein
MLTNQMFDAVRRKASRTSPGDAETTYNAVIAALNDISPRDPLERMLAAQLVATHMAAMDCYERLNRTNDRDVHGYNLNKANKLSRTYVSLLEALNRHRGKGQQKVTVEHVHVHHGGQAIVGHVEHQGGGVAHKTNGSTPCVNGSGMQSGVGLRRDAAHRAREWLCPMAAAGCTEVLPRRS